MRRVRTVPPAAATCPSDPLQREAYHQQLKRSAELWAAATAASGREKLDYPGTEQRLCTCGSTLIRIVDRRRFEDWLDAVVDQGPLESGGGANEAT